MIEARHIEIGTVKKTLKYLTKNGVERKGERGGRGAADLAMRVLRAVYGYGVAVYDDVFIRNPVVVLSKTDGWFKLDRRESFISSDQIRPWFEAVNSLENVKTRVYMLLGLFTGARKNELAKLTWNAIDLVNGVGTFRDTKNGKILIVPFAGYVVNMLKDYQKSFYTGPEGFVFPSYGKTGRVRDLRSPLEKITEQSGVSFMIHDFRRSFLTYANVVGVPVWTQKRLVNHARPDDVTQGYVQHEIEALRHDVEAVAQYILEHAGLDGSPATMTTTHTGNVSSLAEQRLKKMAA
jgi:integrase